MRFIRSAMERDDAGCLPQAQTEGSAVTRFMKDCRRRHLVLLSGHDMPPLQSTIYMDMLNYYRRMRDHALNIAEVIAREK